MNGSWLEGGFRGLATSAISLIALTAAVSGAAPAFAADAPAWPPQQQGFWPTGALSPDNLHKPRPKPPFDLTGTWLVIVEAKTGGAATFRPMPKLKPAAQRLFEAGQKANAEGKAFRDDTGACWPAGMPKFMNRVWPIQILQVPTMLLMTQQLGSQIRWIYLDGRGHSDPDISTPTYNGDSIGRWEGDSLVVNTTQFEPNRHWVEQGVPISNQFQITEHFRLTNDGKEMQVTLVMTDPVNWEGEWINEKRYRRVDDQDSGEVQCLPDTNDHLTATSPEHNVR